VFLKFGIGRRARWRGARERAGQPTAADLDAISRGLKRSC
jgi:hypothetical protein